MTHPPPPPGVLGEVRTASALVLAPHYDDEVLGCGGLVRRLIEDGAAVRVLFLSDSAGGVEAGDPTVGDPVTYRQRRRAEAAAAAEILGLTGTAELGLPDGELGSSSAELVEGVRAALLAQRPELLLVPSPLETTADHRAAFAAVHRLLAGLRTAPGATGDSGLPRELAGLRILAYEVNHPLYPDLLVDVAAQLPVVERAMAAYASQQERHDYWGAYQGMLRYRAVTLGPGGGAVEAYRSLVVDDFTTRSPAALVAFLGGAPTLAEVREGPRLSVVVRTKDRPGLLAEALGSLATSTYRRAEVVVVNDGGEPPELPGEHPLALRRVDLDGNRGRAAAANAGVAAATGDAVIFLDDDDLAMPEHLATLAGLLSGAGVEVAYTDAAVGVYELAAEGVGGARGWVCRERRVPYSRDFDGDLLRVDNYIPWNTVAVDRRLLLAVGPIDEGLEFFEDWELLIRLAERRPFHHLARVTCEYRHFRGGGHHVLGDRPRDRPDFLATKARVMARHPLSPERLAAVVDRLRGEAVAAAEEATAERRAGSASEERFHRLRGAAEATARRLEVLEDLHRRDQAELQSRDAQLAERAREIDRLGGEVVARDAEVLRRDDEIRRRDEEIRRRDEELQRLYDREVELVAAVGEQDAALQAGHREIERLDGLVRAMQQSRAWRVHEWIERRKGRP